MKLICLFIKDLQNTFDQMSILTHPRITLLLSIAIGCFQRNDLRCKSVYKILCFVLWYISYDDFQLSERKNGNEGNKNRFERCKNLCSATYMICFV